MNTISFSLKHSEVCNCCIVFFFWKEDAIGSIEHCWGGGGAESDKRNTKEGAEPREGNESSASEVGEAGTQIPLLEMTPALLSLILDAFF